jgi:hygromycin-B 7''-O-kinase
MPIIQEICRKHGIPSNNLEMAKAGSNVVFFVDRKWVVKLFAPIFKNDFVIESTILEKLKDRLDIAIPEVIAKGQIEDWPYFIMSFLEGYPLEKIWKEIAFSNQTGIIHQLGRIMRDLHALSLDEFKDIGEDWNVFMERQMEGCVEHHKKQGLVEPYIQELAELLEKEKERCKTFPYKRVLLHADIAMHEHILLEKKGERWQIAGLLDFADGMIGHYEYEFVEPCIFIAGNVHFLKTLFLSGKNGLGMEILPVLNIFFSGEIIPSFKAASATKGFTTEPGAYNPEMTRLMKGLFLSLI